MNRLSYSIQSRFQAEKAKALVDTQRLKPYTLGSAIRFCSGCNGLDQVGFLAGWWQNEPWGTWTNGQVADFIIQVPLLVREDLLLIARMRTLIDAGQPQQVDVSINDKMIKHWTLDSIGLNERCAVIPASLAMLYQPMHVTFDVLHPVAPSTIGASTDDRLLGLGMEELHIYGKGQSRVLCQ
jgi:hypothetical protein